jgi:hypothetical protein
MSRLDSVHAFRRIPPKRRFRASFRPRPRVYAEHGDIPAEARCLHNACSQAACVRLDGGLRYPQLGSARPTRGRDAAEREPQIHRFTNMYTSASTAGSRRRSATLASGSHAPSPNASLSTRVGWASPSIASQNRSCFLSGPRGMRGQQPNWVIRSFVGYCRAFDRRQQASASRARPFFACGPCASAWSTWSRVPSKTSVTTSLDDLHAPTRTSNPIRPPAAQGRPETECRSPLTLRSPGLDRTTFSRVPDRCQRRTGAAARNGSPWPNGRAPGRGLCRSSNKPRQQWLHGSE